MNKRPVILERTLGILAALLLLGLSGCLDSRQAELETEYGQISKEPTSINGLSILAAKIQARSASVTSRKKISPMLDRYDTVFWFPKDRNCPSPNALAALQQWLENGSNRTLVFVAGNYDAKSDYLQQVFDTTPVEEREEMLRLVAEQKIERVGNNPFGFWIQPEDGCTWFSITLQPGLESNDLSGPMAAGFTAESYDRLKPPELPFEYLLKPAQQPFGSYGNTETTSLLNVEGESFVWSVEDSNYWSGKLIVVSNASFLVNFSLVDPARERLADALLDEVGTMDEVLFLESGPQQIRVSDNDYENHNSWAWISEKPLRYIVPHFLFWGILFCFVFFPIFGRPRKIPKKSTTSFRSHINAIAKQMERSGRVQEAQDRVARFREKSVDRSASHHDSN